LPGDSYIEHGLNGIFKFSISLKPGTHETMLVSVYSVFRYASKDEPWLVLPVLTRVTDVYPTVGHFR
jgi:hypothetical protein